MSFRRLEQDIRRLRHSSSRSFQLYQRHADGLTAGYGRSDGLSKYHNIRKPAACGKSKGDL
jgi:hypothetical protein